MITTEASLFVLLLVGFPEMPVIRGTVKPAPGKDRGCAIWYLVSSSSGVVSAKGLVSPGQSGCVI